MRYKMHVDNEHNTKKISSLYISGSPRKEKYKQWPGPIQCRKKNGSERKQERKGGPAGAVWLIFVGFSSRWTGKFHFCHGFRLFCCNFLRIGLGLFFWIGCGRFLIRWTLSIGSFSIMSVPWIFIKPSVKTRTAESALSATRATITSISFFFIEEKKGNRIRITKGENSQLKTHSCWTMVPALRNKLNLTYGRSWFSTYIRLVTNKSLTHHRMLYKMQRQFGRSLESFLSFNHFVRAP